MLLRVRSPLASKYYMKMCFYVGYKLYIAAQHRECLFFPFVFHFLVLLWLKILFSHWVQQMNLLLNSEEIL